MSDVALHDTTGCCSAVITGERRRWTTPLSSHPVLRCVRRHRIRMYWMHLSTLYASELPQRPPTIVERTAQNAKGPTAVVLQPAGLGIMQEQTIDYAPRIQQSRCIVMHLFICRVSRRCAVSSSLCQSATVVPVAGTVICIGTGRQSMIERGKCMSSCSGKATLGLGLRCTSRAA